MAAGLPLGAQADDDAAKAARHAREIEAIRTAVARGELLPLPRVMALAKARVPGDVVKTELESKHGRLTYEIKVLTASGRLQEVKLDARSGAVLEVEDD
jgi:uncharacterized membrane protein YkoI